MQNNYNNENYAGFWVRLAAYLIDSIIVGVGLLIVKLLISGVMALFDGTLLGGNILFNYTLKDIILYIVKIVYFVLLTYYTGTTLGKRVMNLRVVPADRKQKLSFIDVLYRETIGRFLCGIFMCIGYILVGVDKEKRGLHDMLSDTRVVYEKKVKVYPVYQAPVRPVPPIQGQSLTPQGQQSVSQQIPVKPIQPEVQSREKAPKQPQFPEGGYHMVKPEENKETEEQQERNS